MKRIVRAASSLIASSATGGRLALALALLAAAAGIAAAQGALPHGLEQITSLEQGRARLWELREAGTIDQARYLELARQLEPRLRSRDVQKLMDDVGIKHTGRPPVRSGGILSDVDGSAPNAAAYEEFLRRVRALDPDVEVHDRYSFRSQKLDLIGWRPREDVPAARTLPGQIEQATAQSLNDELALGARPGATAHPAESNLENLTKGARQIFGPLKHGYEGEMDMVAAGKDVLRSMRAAGMCDNNPAVCGWLNDLRSRAKSPRELGFKDPAQLQARLKALAGEAYRSSHALFAKEHDDLVKQLGNAGTGPERDRLIQLADEMAERATRMGARHEVLHKQYPNDMRELAGSKPPGEYWREQNERVRKLRQAQAVASGNVASARSLNVLLNVLEFGRCMQEETTAAPAARRAQAAHCIARAVAGAVAGEGIGWATGKAVNLVTVYLPHGPMIATVIPAALAGVAAYEAGIQVIDAGFEYWQKNIAEAEVQAREDALAQAQLRNVAEFPRRLAAEEAVIQQALRDIAARKQGLLDELARLGREQVRIADSIELRPRRTRLEQLLPAIKANAQACWSAVGERGGPRTGPMTELRELVDGARELMLACHARGDVQLADAALHESQRQLDALRRDAERRSPRHDAAAGAAPSGGPRTASSLDEARQIHLALEEAALSARSNLRDVAAIRDQVRAINESIEKDQQGLTARLEAFIHAVPPTLVQVLEQHSARLQTLRDSIAGIRPMESMQWHPQWEAISRNDTALRALVQYMDDPGRRSGRVLAEAEECRQGMSANRHASIELDAVEETLIEMRRDYPVQRASCVARLDALEAQARFRHGLSREEAALRARLNSLKALRDEAVAKYDDSLQAARARVAQTIAARPAGAAAPGNAEALVAGLAAAPKVCGQLQSAQYKLSDALRSIEDDAKDVEFTLTRAQQLAASCKDRAMADQAQVQVQHAQALQTSVDQRVAALALLAVQVDSLAVDRIALIKQREEAAGLAARPAGAAPAAVVDVSALQARLNDLRAYGEAWGRREAETHHKRLAQFQAEHSGLVAASSLQPGMATLRALVDGIAALALKDDDLGRRAGEVAALEQHARAAAGQASRPATDARAVQAAVHAASCLDSGVPDMAAGTERAQSLRVLAQLATQKLGAGASEKILACAGKLAGTLSSVDKQERVARANCSRFPHTAPRWSEQKNAVVCSCEAGYRPNAEIQACEPDREAAVAAKQCRGDHKRAYWDSVTETAQCGCVEGYREDPVLAQCEIDKAALVAKADCSRFAHAVAYWNNAKNKASCKCAEGFQLSAQAQACEPTATPTPTPARSRYAGWLGKWSCQASVDVNGTRQFNDRGTAVIADDARGGLRMSADSGSWEALSPIDDTHVRGQLSTSDGMSHIVFELSGDVFSGQRRIKAGGDTMVLTMTCRR